MGWLYCKIYAKDAVDWYYKLLNEVVKPYVKQNDPLIDKFFFFNYVEDYGVQSKETIKFEPECEHKFEAGERVRFVRFRVRGKDENLRTLEDSLLNLIGNSPTVLKSEKCEYDVAADLGNRFGQSRTELAVNYLDAFCRMVLSLVDPNNQLEDGDKPYSAVHLIHNIIGSPIKVGCANPQCREMNSVNTLIAFQCQKCSMVTYF